MKLLIYCLLLTLGLSLSGAVSELEKLVPEATDYELIYHCRPMEFSEKGYHVNRSRELHGKLKRLGYLLKLTEKNDKMYWMFVEMDPFTQDLDCVGVPTRPEHFAQTYVSNMKVSGNHPKLNTGSFDKGNIEFWCGGFKCVNSLGIPGASDRSYDFGDSGNPKDTAGYGSMQVHNFLHQRTVFAFNNFKGGASCDLGIGSNLPLRPGGGFADWTFSKSAEKLKDAELFVVGRFGEADTAVSKPDFSATELRGETEKAFYAVDEEITFTIHIDKLTGVSETSPLHLLWTCRGDDGQTLQGMKKIVSVDPVIIRTKLKKPGFVWLRAILADEKGNPLKQGKKKIVFDGGAGAEVEKLASVLEPTDFDAFWNRQKERLAAVPMGTPVMKKFVRANDPMEVYSISIPCAGARPVTGYVRIPRNAAPGSQKVLIWFHGYGVSPHVPNWKAVDYIEVSINAHGFELARSNAYYKNFSQSIMSNGKRYAFDPVQNSDPEQAYFNGMALRVMRSLEFVRTLPQWNGRDLTVFGSSQGGMQAVWAAALDHTVTRCEIEVPWCCDMAGRKSFGRIGGWFPPYVPALEYYDPVHAAKRIPVSCQVVINRVGLGDYTCPPSGITVLYNNITAPKKISYYQGSTHGSVPKKTQIFIFEKIEWKR